MRMCYPVAEHSQFAQTGQLWRTAQVCRDHGQSKCGRAEAHASVLDMEAGVFHKGIRSLPGAAPCSDFQSRGCWDRHCSPHAKGGWEQFALLLLPKASISRCYESSTEAKHS